MRWVLTPISSLGGIFSTRLWRQRFTVEEWGEKTIFVEEMVRKIWTFSALNMHCFWHFVFEEPDLDLSLFWNKRVWSQLNIKNRNKPTKWIKNRLLNSLQNFEWKRATAHAKIKNEKKIVSVSVSSSSN